jgi:ABC transporter, phosphonate, periplasmic substrate-binding protein
MYIKSCFARNGFKLALLYLCLIGLSAHAKTEYIIGLTAQGIRSATTEEVELGFNYQLESLSKGKDYSLKIKVFSTEEQLTQAILDRKLVGYFGTPLLYFQHVNQFDSDLLFSPVLSDKVMQRYLLLVRDDSGVAQIDKLKNTKLSYCAADEVGLFYLNKLIEGQKLGALNTFFSKLTIKKNPSLAISAVFFKETQATIVLESDYIVATEINPQLKKQLRVMHSSPEYITNLLVISKGLDGPMKPADIEANVLSLGGAIQSKKLMKSYNYGAMRKISFEDLNSVRNLINSVKDDKGLPR